MMTTLFAVLVFGGCAPLPFDVGAAPTPIERTSARRDTQQPVSVESLFDPSKHHVDDVLAAAQRVIKQITLPHVEVAEVPDDGKVVVYDTTWVMDEGYRIQIAASPTREDAERFAEAARERLPSDSVYVYFQAPWYKVRVGDFATRGDAEDRLKEVRKIRTYREAFWVPSEIRVPRIREERVTVPQYGDDAYSH